MTAPIKSIFLLSIGRLSDELGEFDATLTLDDDKSYPSIIVFIGYRT